MAIGFSLAAVVILAVLGAAGGAALNGLFGVVLPYLAFGIFLVGFVVRVVDWASSPVPFRIPTTGGQQKSLPWIQHSNWDNPVDTKGTVIRMLLEVLTFRSLFRNTTFENRPDIMRLGIVQSIWLWLFALIFHYSFLIVVLRHLRFFFEPIPGCVNFLDNMDSILQIGLPPLYLTDVMLLAGVGFLFFRRLYSQRLRYISLAGDYFPLLLIAAIALSGMYMRYVARVDVAGVKKLAYSLVTFSPMMVPDLHWSFYMHLFLVCVLLAYFPASKLMHMGGVFLSPTRNLPNDTRIHMHVNPWNDPSIKPHSYEDYENDYREKMIEAGLPVEKEA